MNISPLTDLLGKTVDELQTNIVIGSNGVISGTLNYVDDYTGFDPSNPELQVGHYLALHAAVDDEKMGPIPYDITVTLTNPVVLDEDGIVVLYIRDKNSQTVTVVASAEGYPSVTSVYRLTGLTLEPAA